MKKALKILGFILLAILLLLVGGYGLLHIPSVQTRIAQAYARNLSAKLHTRVEIDRVKISFFDRIECNNLTVFTQTTRGKSDTLVHIGRAEVQLNDWFFLKDTITIKNLNLSNLYVNAQRSEKAWNYDFLIDYFSGSNSKKSTTKQQQPILKVDKLHVHGLKLHEQDGWLGEDHFVETGSLDISFNKFDLSHHQIGIKKIEASSPLFRLFVYQGNPAHSNLKQDAKKEAHELFWQVRADEFVIKHGTFVYDKETSRKPYGDRFDESHIQCSDLNVMANQMTWLKDSLTGIVQLSTKERCGFQIDELKTKVKITPKIMEFDQLSLRTPKSQVGDYYAMRYEDFTKDMKEYVNRVQMDGNFKNCVVHTDDIAYFAPAVRYLNRKIEVQGKANGTVNNLQSPQLYIRSNQTKLDGSISIQSIADLNQMKISWNSQGSFTQASEIKSLYPGLSANTYDLLNKFGQINFKGNYLGGLDAFKCQGIFTTQLGSLTTQLDYRASIGTSGEISTSGFQIGTMTANKSLGLINGIARFNLHQNGKLDFDATINKVDWNAYSYQHITAAGSYHTNRFEGKASIDDPNLKVDEWVGAVALNAPLQLQFGAMIQYAHLKKLGLTDKEFIAKGRLSLNTSGTTLDDFIGQIHLEQSVIETEQHESLPINTLTLESSKKDDGLRNLQITSDVLDANIEGDFRLSTLADAFRASLHHYYPSTIEAPIHRPEHANFTYLVSTHQIGPWLKVYLPRITGGDHSRFTGHIDLSSGSITLQGNIPEMSIDGKSFSQVDLLEEGDSISLKSLISAKDIQISDSFHLPGAELSITSIQDSSIIQLKTGANNTIHEAELNASFQGFSNGFKLHFFPSSCYLNDKKWTLEKDGEFILRNDIIQINDFRFTQANQSLRITTELDDESNQQRIVAELSNIELEDLIPLLTNDGRYIKGAMNGKVIFSDSYNNLKATASLKANELQIEGQRIGELDVETDYDKTTGLLNYKAISNDSINHLNMTGQLNLSDTAHIRIQSKLEAKTIDLSILSPYLSNVFDEVKGIAVGNLNITGELGMPEMTGKMTVRDATLKVGYTKCRYFIQNQDIQLEKNQLSFPMITITDSLKHTGTVNGIIRHQQFKDFYFDNVRVETDKMALLNTTERDNSNFYGNIIGDAKVTFNGPLSNLLINIDGGPSNLDSSHIYISGAETKASKQIDYIEFVNNLKTEEEKKATVPKNNLLVNLIVRAKPSCKVDVILDEATGDVIKGEGQGNLTIQVGNIMPLSIKGNYELTKGEYTFKFQTFLNKPFTLKKGRIDWSGDPFAANIDILAEYLVKNLDVSSLTTGSNYQQLEKINIVSHLTGVLKNPVVEFDFELPEGSQLKNDEVFKKRLAEFKNDNNEMTKQVTSLLLFNTFITGNQNFISQSNANTLISNTIGGAVSNLLTNMLNLQLEKATKGILSTYIDINPTLDLQRSLSQIQANIRAGLKISLSKRLNVLLGGNLDYNNPLFTQQLDKKGLITPDITIEWIINRDGTLRVVGFNRSNMDITLTQRKQSGLQLSYQKDMEHLSEIFKPKEKKK